VTSPNPENAEALRMGIRWPAEQVPISSLPQIRTAIAWGGGRTASGEMQLLTGNQIGSLIAYYRTKSLFAVDSHP
jgi:phosphoglucomutase